MQKWRPTLCAGVALDLVVIVEFEFGAATYTLCWRRAGSNCDNLICTQMWLPTLCAAIALPVILVLKF